MPDGAAVLVNKYDSSGSLVSSAPLVTQADLDAATTDLQTQLDDKVRYYLLVPACRVIRRTTVIWMEHLLSVHRDTHGYHKQGCRLPFVSADGNASCVRK